ncbi:complement factor H isoform X4 [Acipenser oxyrinchus oxyrinchus]|uniref:Complement factor H isoform X4 n=1 Tax=Acipenser oxyrinchus oxyrinchus TaxID=40147 RepID=A0AAD8D7Z5_ACIOX|nr:complement factor H isoform X4 [Acipenser oxyrinchus oxyrinchus]
MWMIYKKYMKMKGFVFFLALLNCAATVTQACGFPPTLENGYITEGEKNEYSKGDVVIYACHSGYISGRRVKSMCTGDKWETLRGTCRKKPCGSPGDTANGKFHLEGEDFVYTAKVIYTCNEGYQMASLMDYRICLADGWSNDIPHCEVLTCIPEKTDDNIDIISGMFQPGEPIPYANALRFECNSEHLVLRGESEIYCTANGTWSKPFPKCKEITCEPPSITHGLVRQQKETYENNEVITFHCHDKYRPAERSLSTCTKWGWSPEPRCEEITCVKPHNMLYGDIDSYKREFKISEAVTLRCNDGYQTVNKKDREKATCTETGEWSIPLLCKAITCRVYDIPHGWLYFQNREYKINEAVTLRCNNGYQTVTKKDHEKATCTKTGEWSIPLLCKEITCVIPHNMLYGGIDSYKREFKINEAVTLRCNDGYQTVNKKDREKATCTETGEWSVRILCKEEKCQAPIISDGYFHSDDEDYKTGTLLYYACGPEHKPIIGDTWWKVIKCVDGKWSGNAKCIGNALSPPNIENASNTTKQKEVYNNNEIVEYDCHAAYEPENGSSAVCVNGAWELPKCILNKTPCGTPPYVQYAVITNKEKKYYENDTVTYKCKNNTSLEGSKEITCQNGSWTQPPKCLKVVISRRCEPLKIDNGFSVPEKSTYDPNESVELGCYPPYELKGQRKITCENGHWTETPQCQRNDGTCGPLPTVKDGVIIKGNEGSKSVTYGCQIYYVLEGDSTVRCQSGKWSDAPTCIGPCIINKQQLKEKKLRDTQKIYLEHGKSHKFVCIYGYRVKDTKYREEFVTCEHGQLDVPECMYDQGCLGFVFVIFVHTNVIK